MSDNSGMINNLNVLHYTLSLQCFVLIFTWKQTGAQIIDSSSVVVIRFGKKINLLVCVLLF